MIFCGQCENQLKLELAPIMKDGLWDGVTCGSWLSGCKCASQYCDEMRQLYYQTKKDLLWSDYYEMIGRINGAVLSVEADDVWLSELDGRGDNGKRQ